MHTESLSRNGESRSCAGKPWLQSANLSLQERNTDQACLTSQFSDDTEIYTLSTEGLRDAVKVLKCVFRWLRSSQGWIVCAPGETVIICQKHLIQLPSLCNLTCKVSSQEALPYHLKSLAELLLVSASWENKAETKLSLLLRTHSLFYSLKLWSSLLCGQKVLLSVLTWFSHFSTLLLLSRPIYKPYSKRC